MQNPENLFSDILDYFLKGKTIHRNFRPDWLKNPDTGRNLELDFYIPELSLAYEIQGIHHKTEYQKEKDYIKKRVCKERGISLVHIWSIEQMYSILTKLALLSKKTIPKFFRSRIASCFKFYTKEFSAAKKFGKASNNLHRYYKRNLMTIRKEKAKNKWRNDLNLQKEETESVRRRNELKANTCATIAQLQK